jgi:hypothetical protein
MPLLPDGPSMFGFVVLALWLPAHLMLGAVLIAMVRALFRERPR